MVGKKNYGRKGKTTEAKVRVIVSLIQVLFKAHVKS